MSVGDLLTATTVGARRVVWSPDGRLIAAGGTKQVTLIDAETGSQGWQVDEWETIRSLTFSPDGSRIALFASASGTSHRVRMLDAGDGHEIWSKAHSTPDTTPTGGDMEENPVGTLIAMGLAMALAAPAIEAFLEGIAQLEFSPNGTLLAFAGLTLDAGDGNERLRLPRDPVPQEGSLLKAPPVPAFSADSQWVAARSGEQVTVVSTASGETRWTVPAPGGVSKIAFDEDDRRVVVASDSRVRVLDAESGEEHSNALLDRPIGGTTFVSTGPQFLMSPDRRLLTAYSPSKLGAFAVADGARRFEPLSLRGWFNIQHPVRARFSPAGNLIAVNRSVTTESGNGLMLIQAHTGVTVWEVTSGAFNDVAVSPDGTRLAVGGPVRVYDTGLERSRWRHQGSVERVAASAAGIRLVASAGGDQKVGVIHADSGEPLREWSHSTSVNSIAFSPDGQHLATGSKDGGARLYETVSGNRRWQVAHGRSVNVVAFTPPDGTGVVTASGDKTARLLHADTGEQRWQLPHPQAVTHIAVSPDGLRVATGCADRSTRLLDSATGAELFRYPHETEVRALAFGPAAAGGSLLATAADETVLLVDTSTGAELSRLIHRSAVTAVAVSPDGSLLATGTGGFDRTVRVYDLGAGEPVLRHERELLVPVNRLAFNPVSRRLAVLTEGEIRLLDPEAGMEVARILHPAPVNDIAMSPDGAFLVTACDDGFARVFSEDSG